VPKVENRNTLKPFSHENRSGSPVLTVESLLEGSPTLRRKPVKQENTTPVTVDSVLGSPSNVLSTLKPMQRSPGPKAKVNPEVGKPFNDESNGMFSFGVPSRNLTSLLTIYL